MLLRVLQRVDKLGAAAIRAATGAAAVSGAASTEASGARFAVL